MAASYKDYTSTTSTIKDFTFPYIKQSDIKVRKTTSAGVVTELVEGTAIGASPGEYTWTNATRITVNDAPVSADTIRVYRDTASDALVGTFYPGSAIRSSDLNDNFTQNLYVTQEAEDSVDGAVIDAASALTKATTAETDADASILATDAFVAKNTAAAGETPVWVVRGNAGTDSTEASDPQSGVGKAITDSASALAKALEAIDDADAAVTTANAAYSDVQVALDYKIVADKAALIALTLNNSDDSDTGNLGDFYEVTDATYINTDDIDDSTSSGGNITWVDSEGTTGATAEPNPDTMTGVTWDDKITVKVRWRGDTEKWEYVSYRNNDPESNYVRSASPTFTGAVQNNATVTVGVDETGYDVKFFGDTASAYCLWDASEDDLILAGVAELVVPDGQLKLGSTLVTSTADELNTLDITTAGTAQASKAVVLDGSKNITGLNDIAAVDLTLSGDLTVNGTTTTVNQTNLDVSDNIIGLNRGASTNANDSGIIIERGSTGDNAIIAWDESEDKFTVGTTAATPSDTGDLTITTATLVVGTLEDSEGDVRSIPENAETTDYTLVATDAGKHIKFTPGDASQTLTVPDSVFASGDAVTIVNNSGNNLAIAKGTNMYYAADATNADRTLAGRGVATLLFIADDTCYITGAGLS